VFLNIQEAHGLETNLREIHEQLQQIPSHGIGYGMLRHLSNDSHVKARLADIPVPALSFNYLGQFDQVPAAGSYPIRIAAEKVGLEQHPDDPRSALVYLIAIVTGGELEVHWSYSREQFKKKTIKTLAASYLDELRAMLCLA
jgi:non-ribosomal peptide synthase protein (TIGR01720 family)